MNDQNVNSCPHAVALLPEPSPGLRDLFDFSPDVICILDHEARFLEVSRAAEVFWGYAPGALRGRCCTDFIVAEDRDRTLQMLEQTRKGAVVSDFVNHYRCKDGSVKPMAWSAKWNPARQEVYCTGREGTEKFATEKKAGESEQRLYRAYRLAGIGWWEWLVEDDQLQVSDELYEIYGLNKTDYPCFRKEDYLALVHPDDRELVLVNIGPELRQPFHQYDHRIIRPSGEVIHVIHYVRNECDKDGRLIKRHGTTKNITERKTAEAALKASRQKLKDIVESLGDGFFALDREWRITYWNRKAELITGMDRQALLGINFWALYPKAQQLKFYPQFLKALTDKVPVYFEEFSPSMKAWMEVSAYPTAEGLSVYIRAQAARGRAPPPESKTEENRGKPFECAGAHVGWFFYHRQGLHYSLRHR
jgi:PAS domain S-box-containing protein